MDCVIIFVPDSLKTKSSGYLVGVHQEKTSKSNETFYILDLKEASEFTSNGGIKIIGTYCSSNESLPLVPRRKNWVSISNLDGNLIVVNVTVRGIFQDQQLLRIVLYDRSCFLQSELILLHESNNYGADTDYFKKLSFCLREIGPEKDASPAFSSLLLVINYFLWLLSWVYEALNKLMPVLKYTSIGLHIKCYIRNVLWLLETIEKEKRLSLKTGNYLLSLVTNTIIGYILLHFLMRWTQPDEIFVMLSLSAEKFVNSLFLLMEWLMGSPAGLKLNRPLNEILGSFFLYNIKLWWAFLGIMRPVLEYSFFIFLKIGLLGLSFQIAIIQDLITVVTFHTYCIYIYAARLFGLQISGLCSLSRVFLGRNRNPEPGRVDSCPYTTEQLFVGTISFTVLLFLLPTTMVYYIVFLLMRLGLNVVCGLMSWAIYAIQVFPFYSTGFWLFCPNYTTLTVKITPKQSEVGAQNLILFAKPVTGSWLTTTSLCLPDIVSPPPPLHLGAVFKKMISGKLIPPW